MVDYRVIIAGVLGIGPALFLLFHAVRKYDVPFVEHPLFDSAKLFGMFALGMIFGGIATLLTFWSIPPGLTFLILLLFLLVVALIEELFKFIVVNMKPFQLKYDTTFYGLSLGLGIGAVSMLMTGYLLLPIVFDNPWKYLSVLLTGVYSVSICSLHAGTGCYIGYGSATGQVWTYFFQAMIARAVYVIFILPFVLGSSVLDGLGLLSATIFSIFLYLHIYYKILPESLPDKERKKIRRRIRKMRIGSKG